MRRQPTTTEAPAGWRPFAQGKVRELYSRGKGDCLMVASDRISAFDVVFDEEIPGKGEILTRVSRHWFGRVPATINSHCLEDQDRLLRAALDDADYRRLGKRAMLVKQARPLRIEAIVRQHLEGSAWREYQQGQTVGGERCPSGLRRYDRLPRPVFTPTTKAEQGGKDAAIDDEQARELIGGDCYDEVRESSLRLFAFAADAARERGLILCDTKFEFGLDDQGSLMLIDELLTPDSSRYWLLEDYERGAPEPMDKQFLRDWLSARGFAGTPPVPPLAPEITGAIAERYRELMRRLGADR